MTEPIPHIEEAILLSPGSTKISQRWWKWLFILSTIQAQLASGVKIFSGTGSPNGAVTGSPGNLYLNLSGGAGTTLWVKESGTNTNTGWIGK